LFNRQLFGGAAELMTRQTLDQQPQLVIHGRQRTRHLLQRGQIIWQCVQIYLHTAVMDDVFASVPELSCRCHSILRVCSIILPTPAALAPPARHSQPSSKAASCAEVSAIRSELSADGQAN
jgi:hypothetical protein